MTSSSVNLEKSFPQAPTYLMPLVALKYFSLKQTWNRISVVEVPKLNKNCCIPLSLCLCLRIWALSGWERWNRRGSGGKASLQRISIRLCGLRWVVINSFSFIIGFHSAVLIQASTSRSPVARLPHVELGLVWLVQALMGKCEMSHSPQKTSSDCGLMKVPGQSIV